MDNHLKAYEFPDWLITALQYTVRVVVIIVFINLVLLIFGIVYHYVRKALKKREDRKEDQAISDMLDELRGDIDQNN